MKSTLRRPRPRSRYRLVRALRAAWTFPTNALGHALGRALSRRAPVVYRSDYAEGSVYLVTWPPFLGVGAVTLGNAILAAPEFTTGLRGELIIAHELAHTRQHDHLGPLYLPSHAVLQALSATLWLVRPVEGSDPVHAHNPLEQRWLFLGHSAIRDLLAGRRWTIEERDALLRDLAIR